MVVRFPLIVIHCGLRWLRVIPRGCRAGAGRCCCENCYTDSYWIDFLGHDTSFAFKLNLMHYSLTFLLALLFLFLFLMHFSCTSTRVKFTTEKKIHDCFWLISSCSREGEEKFQLLITRHSGWVVVVVVVVADEHTIFKLFFSLISCEKS